MYSETHCPHHQNTYKSDSKDNRMKQSYFSLSGVFVIILLCCIPVSAHDYTLRAGDTFETIAAQYGVRATRIKAANPRVKSIIPGVIINIPPVKITPMRSIKADFTSVQDFKYWKEHHLSKDKGLRKNAVAALERSSAANHYEAQIEYFKALFYGSSGIKKNKIKALSILTDAASKGNPKAQYIVYERYNYMGAAKEFPSSFPDKEIIDMWFDDAVEAGEPKAMHNKAKYFLMGFNSLPKDTAKACALYEKIISDTLNRKEYSFEFNTSVKDLTGLRSHIKCTSTEAYKKGTSLLAAGKEELANIYLQRAVDLGNGNAMSKLADNYVEGRGIASDKGKAARLYEAAIKKGVKSASAKAKALKKETALENYMSVNGESNENCKAVNNDSGSKSSKKTDSPKEDKGTKKNRKKNQVWDKILNALNTTSQILEAVGNTADKINDIQRNNHKTPSDGYNTYTATDAASDASDTDDQYYYIPDLLRELNSKTAACRQTNADNARAREKTRKNAKYKYTRVGGKMIKVIDPDRTVVYKTNGNKMDDAARNNVIKYFDDIAKSVKKYGIVNHTDYIPKERYKAIVSARADADEQRRQNNKMVRKHLSDQRNSKVYDDYVRMLQNLYYNDKRDFDASELNWVRDCQRKMKKLRLESGCTQSKWETWDGIHKP